MNPEAPGPGPEFTPPPTLAESRQEQYEVEDAYTQDLVALDLLSESETALAAATEADEGTGKISRALKITASAVGLAFLGGLAISYAESRGVRLPADADEVYSGALSSAIIKLQIQNFRRPGSKGPKEPAA